MLFSAGVRTRTVICEAHYPYINSHPNLDLKVRIKLSSSRKLLWNDTLVENLFSPVQYGLPGEPASFECIVTDMVGMKDAKTGQLIDISNGSHTHFLTSRMRVFQGMDIVWEDTKKFVVPTSDDPLILVRNNDPGDSDNHVTPDPTTGILIPFAGVSDERIATRVNSYMNEHPAATPDYVNDQMLNHVDSQTPHPVYDDMVDLVLIFENGLI